MYGSGEGISQDYKQAFYWYKKSADQGDADAQFFLGSMYYEGLGVPPNRIFSYFWKNLATSNDGKKIMEIKDQISINLSSYQISFIQQVSTQEAMKMLGDK